MIHLQERSFPFMAAVFVLLTGTIGWFPTVGYAQFSPIEALSAEDDDLNVGGDIFSDYNEDINAAQVQEDERYYRYGRFFSFQIGVGLTTFDGNRGTAYSDDPPSYTLQVNYFMNFQWSFGLGFAFSKHHFFLGEPTVGFDPNPVGFVDISALRTFFSYRYYIDTSDLGTAITYSNPYFSLRFEHWIITNKFVDQSNLDDDSGGGIGFGVGFGFEFPVKLKESYVGVEFLAHSVNFHDKFTQKYRPLPGSNEGFEDLTGNAYDMMVTYVINW